MTKTLSMPVMPAIPAPARAFIRPMLLAAIGMHALLLFAPFPQEKPKPPENKEAPVKITQLPTTKVKVQNKAKIANPNKPSLPKINRPAANPVVIKPEPPKPEAARSQEAPPEKGQVANPASGGATSFVDFPHYQPSTPDCFGKGLGENCRIATANLPTVAAFYQSQPKAKGFTVTLAEENANAKIYTVTAKNGQMLFLSLFADAPTTVILLSEQKVTDLATLKESVSPPEEYYQILADLLVEADRSDNPANTASPENFAQPQMFYNIVSEAELQQGAIPDLRPGIDGTPKLAQGQNPMNFYQSMSAAGLSGFFEISEQGQYGGGNLYRLKKGSTTFYLNLIPTKDQTGTIIVTWLKDPKS
ncbi:hypothetical protein [Leptolyngbya sp. GGD]|uniref:hypothetical protein n=1 Tax=Leptolyngbya sp. GGD TaxID=2997907 RepID=UPI00227B2403|nr:hypothetical protein [Leptolyngbya sp. GGD]MCY6493662.1 hypothetical protein [Leptolyngbya sp. GGD]